MQQTTSPQSNPLPRFERPSEAVVYWTLENLSAGSSGQCSLPLSQLAKRSGLSVSTTNRAVLSLAKRDVISYRRGTNQYQPSLFGITAGEKLSRETTAQPKIGTPNSSDKHDSILDIYPDDNNDSKVIHKQNAQSGYTPSDRLALRVALGLDDIKNLRLYQSYCRKFPAELILKAYTRAREPAPDKIRVSRGALFNFLTQLYAKRGNFNNDSSRPAGPAGNGRGSI